MLPPWHPKHLFNGLLAAMGYSRPQDTHRAHSRRARHGSRERDAPTSNAIFHSMDRSSQSARVLVLFACSLPISSSSLQGDAVTSGFELYQGKFNAALRDLKTEGVVKGPVWIQPEVLSAPEACTSCHLAIQDERFLFARQPYRKHSGHFLEDHPPERFGCTVCHGGAAAGLTFGEALHARSDDPGRQKSRELNLGWKPVGAGSEPLSAMVPLKWITGRCLACHSAEDRDLSFEPYRESREVVAEKRCTACHLFRDGPEKNVPRAVHLDHLGSKLGGDWLVGYLRDPSAFRGATAMPKFALQADEVQVLANYFLAQTQADLTWDARVPVADAAAVQRGKALVEQHRCTTCHDVPGIEDKGFLLQRKIGPDLKRVGEKLNPRWIQRWIADPASLRSGVGMPPFHLEHEELLDVTAFVSSLLAEGAQNAAQLKAPPDPDAAQVASIANRFACAACHQIGGLDLHPPKKSDLRDIASSLFARLAQADTDREALEGPTGVFHRSGIAPQLFGPGENAADVLSFLAAQVDLPLPDSFSKRIPEPLAAFDASAAAEGLVDKLRCLSCHTILGSGGITGPELTFAGSKLKRDWLVSFLQSPTPIRPMNRAHMPILGLTAAQASVLADWIESDLRSPEAEAEPPGLEDAFGFFGSTKVQSPYGCVTCHRIDGKGGSVGPDWTHVGSRLKTNWIYHWILDPQRWVPGVRMPRFEMPDDDRLAITKFLSEQQ